jgi:hypothetical protein
VFLFFSVARSASTSQAERANEASEAPKVQGIEIAAEPEEKMPTDKLVDVSPLALRMSSPFNAGTWLLAHRSAPPDVSNPSAIFLSQHSEPVPGSCVLVTLEGTRPMLVEIQALVDGGGPSPRRLSVGLERDRLAMLLAVLHRHAGVACGDQDVFVNAVGGVRISEPAADWR